MKRLIFILVVLLLTACSSSSSSPTKPASSGPITVSKANGSFFANGYGKAVTEPFDLPAGTYRLTVTTSDSFTAVSVDDVKNQNNCTGIASVGKVTSTSTGEGSVISSGCRAVFNADPADAEWSVQLRPLN